MILRACVQMFKNYANFKGRTSRRDFWISVLMIIIIFSVPVVLMRILSGTPRLIVSIVFGLLELAILVPYFAMIVRRIRDTGKPWYYVFYFCIPLAGIIILLILLLLPSAEGELPQPKKVKPAIPKNTLRK